LTIHSAENQIGENRAFTRVTEMNENIKHNIFGICIAIALLGAFVGGASAATLNIVWVQELLMFKSMKSFQIQQAI